MESCWQAALVRRLRDIDRWKVCRHGSPAVMWVNPNPLLQKTENPQVFCFTVSFLIRWNRIESGTRSDPNPVHVGSDPDKVKIRSDPDLVIYRIRFMSGLTRIKLNPSSDPVTNWV